MGDEFGAGGRRGITLEKRTYVGIWSVKEDARSVKVRLEVLESGRKVALDACLWFHDGAKTEQDRQTPFRVLSPLQAAPRDETTR